MKFIPTHPGTIEAGKLMGIRGTLSETKIKGRLFEHVEFPPHDQPGLENGAYLLEAFNVRTEG